MRIACALVALVFAVQEGEQAADMVRSGDLTGAEGEYRAQLSADPANPELNYNLGTVFLLDGRFDEARPYLETARREEEALNPAASYNLGNTDLEPAFGDPELSDREMRLRRAIDEYKQALLADPEDFDAKWNLELARRLLEREEPPPAGGGGGGGGDDALQGERDPAPSPGTGGGPEPDVSRSEAENLLRAAQERELEIQRDRLQKPQPPGPMRP